MSSEQEPITPDELASDGGLSIQSNESSAASTPLDPPEAVDDAPRRVPSLRSISEPETTTPVPATALRMLANARNPLGGPQSAASSILGGGPDNALLERMRAFHSTRMQKGAPASPSPGPSPVNGVPPNLPNLRMPPGMARPSLGGFPRSAPAIPGVKPSLSERRMGGMKLSGMGGGATGRPGAPKLSDMQGGPAANPGSQGSKMDDYKKYIDADKGWITFDGAATITRTGVNFANGQTFSISLDEIQLLNELGKGNYGTVYRVRHAKPKVPRFGQGLSGMRQNMLNHAYSDPSPVRKDTTNGGGDAAGDSSPNGAVGAAASEGSTGRIMAMKEIRLELDDAKFTTILKELVILHECVSPYIIDFYGAFFQEGAVYICIEYMDGGSIDKLYAGGIPEPVLRKITYSTVMGLKSLKDEHNIIHRDVKPTNILVNTRGQVKICDFGVSGNLVASIARTNIGCQSYMAPERISGGGMSAAGNADGTYSVQSDIWSLGLTIIECAMGRYPYPPEVSSTIFSQLSAIVDGEPPGLPEEGYSAMAHDFVKGCLNKTPSARPTYAMLLGHPWIAPLAKPLTIEEEEEGSDKEKEDQKDGEADGADGADGVDGVDGQPAADGVDGVAQTIAALKITSRLTACTGTAGPSHRGIACPLLGVSGKRYFYCDDHLVLDYLLVYPRGARRY
jgi:mitogen-activated protein kinase kinase